MADHIHNLNEKEIIVIDSSSEGYEDVQYASIGTPAFSLFRQRWQTSIISPGPTKLRYASCSEIRFDLSATDWDKQTEVESNPININNEVEKHIAKHRISVGKCEAAFRPQATETVQIEPSNKGECMKNERERLAIEIEDSEYEYINNSDQDVPYIKVSENVSKASNEKKTKPAKSIDSSVTGRQKELVEPRKQTSIKDPKNKNEALSEISLVLNGEMKIMYPECCQKVTEMLPDLKIHFEEHGLMARWKRRCKLDKVSWEECSVGIVIVEVDMIYDELCEAMQKDQLDDYFITQKRVLWKFSVEQLYIVFIKGKAVEDKLNREFRQAIRKCENVDTFQNTFQAQPKRLSWAKDMRDAVFLAGIKAGIKTVFIDDGGDLKAQRELARFIAETSRCVGWMPYSHASIHDQRNKENEGLDRTINICLDKCRSGIDLNETWILMLEQIGMVSNSIAQAIRNKYPALNLLMEAYRQCENNEEAKFLLARISIERNGATGSRMIGPALSTKLWKVFNSLDPNLPIG